MATKKNENKKNVSNKKQVVNAKNATRVVCPECGAEFDVLAPHEHTVKNATVLGVDSGLGTVYLPVSKRGEALQSAGIDTSKYFSIQLPTGGEQMMKMGDDGRAVPVSADDPIIQAIMGGGTVPNKRLFRRWVMSQVVHGLLYSGYYGDGFTGWMKSHGYVYTWEMLIEELHVQTKLYGKDMENFNARNRWFNKELAVEMATDYVKQLREDANGRPTHKCKGVPYVTVEHQHYFVSDIEKKLINPLRQLVLDIRTAKAPEALEQAVRRFWKQAPVKSWSYDQCPAWKDAYKGMGAYATMQNLLRFHGCTFPKDNDFFERGTNALLLLERAANAYANGEGWRLFGLLKQMIEENHFDIRAKMAEWAAKKQVKH